MEEKITVQKPGPRTSKIDCDYKTRRTSALYEGDIIPILCQRDDVSLWQLKPEDGLILNGIVRPLRQSLIGWSLKWQKKPPFPPLQLLHPQAPLSSNHRHVIHKGPVYWKMYTVF